MAGASIFNLDGSGGARHRGRLSVIASFVKLLDFDRGQSPV